jgi:hypothetical protein
MTDVWKIFGQRAKAPYIPTQRGWLQNLIRITGIGPIDSVITARSQVAVVVTDLGASEAGETLNVKPEAAIVIETHTSSGRIKAPIERALQRLVTEPYRNSQPQRSTIDGVEFLEWRDQAGDRTVVAAFLGSVVILGNSPRAVDICLNVARRRAPSLREDSDLHRTRTAQQSAAALAFGYVPAGESARLVALGAPLVFGRAPGDMDFQKLLGQGAKNILGSMSWTTRPFKGGIEDRYHISLKPSVVAQLKPHFASIDTPSELRPSTNFYSTTQYKFQDPAQTWGALKTTVASHVDALGAVIVNSLMRSGLLTYGIENPEAFLGAVKAGINTVRFDQQGERQLIVARVNDPNRLLVLFEREMRFRRLRSAPGNTIVLENEDGTIGVALNDSFVVVGHPADIQQFFRMITTDNGNLSPDETKRLDYFVGQNTLSPVSTYTNDSERVQTFLVAMLRVSGRDPAAVSLLEEGINSLPYAITETNLGDGGLDRITRSPLGQLGTLIPLFIPDDRLSPPTTR